MDRVTWQTTVHVPPRVDMTEMTWHACTGEYKCSSYFCYGNMSPESLWWFCTREKEWMLTVKMKKRKKKVPLV